MKTTIFYFTGTGNSLKIAKSLSDKLKQSELIPIAKVWEDNNLISTSEKVGFIFPLYYAGLPKIVHDFLSKIDLTNSDYFFAVVTNAGDINNTPLQQIETILNINSKTLNAGFFIAMPNNYILGYDIHPEARQKEFFEEANKNIDAIYKIVEKNETNIGKDFFEKRRIKSEKFNKNFRDSVYESDKSFYAEESCTSCGICVNVCPVNNIALVEDIPQWQHKCQQCLACINFCPEKCIQFGDKTLKTQRYHHPEITVKDLVNQKN
ncbi:MAG: EFR1 family ferrodoxin [Candidatus Lokiarchaeota archaeon]|nr:EFR1 family ferrodoxin [Candidatus Lokiarchaeota archaeon]